MNEFDCELINRFGQSTTQV